MLVKVQNALGEDEINLLSIIAGAWRGRWFVAVSVAISDAIFDAVFGALDAGYASLLPDRAGCCRRHF